MSREVPVRFREGLGVQFPWATRPIVHCRSEAEAQDVRAAIATRLHECRLELHPEKTKIVYGKDEDRRGTSPNERFDFLG